MERLCFGLLWNMSWLRGERGDVVEPDAEWLVMNDFDIDTAKSATMVYLENTTPVTARILQCDGDADKE